jgi:hypothetical protein
MLLIIITVKSIEQMPGTITENEETGFPSNISNRFFYYKISFYFNSCFVDGILVWFSSKSYAKKWWNCKGPGYL